MYAYILLSFLNDLLEAFKFTVALYLCVYIFLLYFQTRNYSNHIFKKFSLFGVYILLSTLLYPIFVNFMFYICSAL